MKEFLNEIASEIHSQHEEVDKVTLVFPNRRAILYFRKHFSKLIKKPTYAPRMLTIEEFFSGCSSLKTTDKLELVHTLYGAYRSVVQIDESFDRFYFWGEMLLRDFEEIDKYLVDADLLFKDLSHQKELDSSFDYLTEEQKEFLQEFWGTFEERPTKSRERFLEVWKKLGEVYHRFRSVLRDKGLAYEGMTHRDVAESLEKRAEPIVSETISLHFVGFNALTKAEEVLLVHCVRNHNAKIHWDIDEYYVNSDWQEAGSFIREYQQHPVLRNTFASDVPANFRSNKSINIYSAPQPIGQAKLMAQVLEAQLAAGCIPDETLVVLPDEKLLIPVLHGVAGKVEKLNVTMGFPLVSTPLFNFIEILVELQMKRNDDLFNHRETLSILGHPFGVAPDPALANSKRKEILHHNWVNIPQGFLATGTDLHRLIFRPADEKNIADYLRGVIECLGSLKELPDFDKEYAFQFITTLNRLTEILGNEYHDLKSFLRLFRQMVRTQRIPFSGEPLQGLQVMGVLETRNLDFKNVFILSLNEGAFPSYGNSGSYLPYNVRRAYELPTVEHQDAIYSYLFYRSIQRAENIHLFYNSETDVLGQGEMSRFLQQLVFESNASIKTHTLHNTIQPHPVRPISIEKDAKVNEALTKLNEGNVRFRGISPSALNTYLECRLKFYFRHLMKIREADEVEEDLDARVLGNFLHDIMEQFYRQLMERKKSKLVLAQDLENIDTTVSRLLDEAFIKQYRLDPKKQVDYDGQRVIVSEIVKRFAFRIFEIDKSYAPFVMEGVEHQGMEMNVKLDHAPGFAVIGGKIDRVDRKDDILRIVDYKTGKDRLDFESIPSLFSRNDKRNKAAFQTMLYALLYLRTSKVTNVKVVPGLLNRNNLFETNFEFGLKLGKQPIYDATEMLNEFEQHLKVLLEELFDPATQFDQTEDLETCRLCPYKDICYR